MATTGGRRRHGNLREAMIEATLELIGAKGTQGFSMAEASRQAGVAQSAPYKHFADREAMLAAVAERAYAELGPRLVAATVSGDPLATLTNAAGAYVHFAADHPAMFAVLFSAGLDKSEHPSLAQASVATFAPLTEAAASIAADARRPDGRRRDADADGTDLAIATVAIAHGYAALMSDGRFGRGPTVVDEVAAQASRTVRAAIGSMAAHAPTTTTRRDQR